MRRAVACAVVAFFAVMLQLTFVDRLALPGGAVPDLVLVIVISLGLTHGPTAGMLAGFFAGLDLDLAPPASHLIGASALTFCLLGYGCGRLTGRDGRSPALLFAAAALAAAIGEALQAAIGIIGDRSVTLQAVRQVLPTVLLYDLLLTPVVLVLVTFTGSARPRRGQAEHRPANALAGFSPARLASAATRIPLATFRSSSAQRGSPQPRHRGEPTRLRISASRRGRVNHSSRLSHSSRVSHSSHVNHSGGFR